MNDKISYKNLNINDQIWIIGSLFTFIASMTLSNIVKNQLKKLGFEIEQINAFSNIAAIGTACFFITGMTCYVNFSNSVD